MFCQMTYMHIKERTLPGDADIFRRNIHSSSYHELQDIGDIRLLNEFDNSFQNDEGEYKNVMVVTVDGGPDENPRYSKTIECTIDYFKTFDLDALFIARNILRRSLAVRKSYGTTQKRYDRWYSRAPAFW